jgi:uncharacterized caspase-like protein
MKHMLRFAVALLVLLVCGPGSPGRAEPAEKRIALVIGNANYQAGVLATPANDAGLIAQTLQAAGFDTAGARDLDEDSLRHAFRDFVEKASGAGPDTVAFIYFSGYGLQLEGENYLVPIDAAISRDADIAAKAVRVSDYLRPLTALQLKATIVVLDAARSSPFAISGQPIAGGLALVEPSPGMLFGFNAAPGTIAPEQQGPYGAYAQALAEMIREGGLSLGEVFERVRLRVNEMTKGAQVPWNTAKLEASFVFFERAADAPPLAASAEQTSAIRTGPIRDLGAQEAYLAALERDRLDSYQEFLEAYPADPMAKRVRAIVAARREAITWRRTYVADTPNGYWSYLRRYPHGSHASDCRRRLAQLAAAVEPPRAFAAIDYDVPPPPPDEQIYVERPVLAFDDPEFGFVPPPPPPVYVLPPPPPEFVVLPPPPPPDIVFALPVPVFVPVPVWTRPPVYVSPPPNNVFFNNIHNTVAVNQTTNVVTVTNRTGQIVSATPRGTPGGVVPAVGPALPPTVARKAALIQEQKLPPPGGRPGTPGTLPAQRQPNQALPAVGSHPLPPPTGKPANLQGPPGTPAPGTAAPLVGPGNPGHKPQAPAAALTPPSGPPANPRAAPGVGNNPPAAGPASHSPPGPPGAPPGSGPGKDPKPVAPAAATGNSPPPPAQTPPGLNGKKPPAAAAIDNAPASGRGLPPPGVERGKPSGPASHNLPPPPAAQTPPALHGQKPKPPPAAAAIDNTPAPGRGPVQRPTPSGPASHNLAPPAAGVHPPPQPPAATSHRPPPASAPAIHHPAPPPPTVQRGPPQTLNRPPPAAAAINRPPPAAAAINRPPPVAAPRPNNPPAAANRACQVVNGRPVCN